MYIPIEYLASWPAPNYDNPVRYGPAIFIVHGILYPIVLLMLGIRTYTRLYISKCFGGDDYLAVFSIFPVTAFSILSILVESYVGWDVHAWDVRPESLTFGLKLVYAAQILFSVGLTLIRLSVAWLISRLFGAGAPKLRRFTIGLMIYMALHGSIFNIILIFQCRPISAYWKLSFVPQKECIDQTAHLLSMSIFNTVNDYMVVCLPMHTVWKLKLPIKQRIFVCLLFAIGFFGSSASIIRTIYIYDSTSKGDRTWTAYPVFIWSAIEIYLALFCACMPPSVGFWRLYYPKLMGKSDRSEQNISKSSKIWSSRSGSNRNRMNDHELTDTDEEERGIVVEQDDTIQSYDHPKNELMEIEESCTAIDSSSSASSSSPSRP